MTSMSAGLKLCYASVLFVKNSIKCEKYLAILYIELSTSIYVQKKSANNVARLILSHLVVS